MLDEKLRSDLDQSSAMLGEMFPPLWRRVFLGSVNEGFTENQAFELLKTYILSQNPHGTKGT